MSPEPPEQPTRAELAKELLRYKMAEYSQDIYCASWLHEVEWELWDEELPDYAPGAEASRKTCRSLAEIAGGWWTWIDDAEDNPCFIPLAEWRERAKTRPKRFE